ncbi:hypothetical protein [Microbacterium sp. K24]|uniref:hypothetical protein n=1 Tax=Microbacterium sp. K24 TaxID=2305446 RepID=UPI00109D7D6F|nr:hypothetical protein [Microbacterium sp. K24]
MNAAGLAHKDDPEVSHLAATGLSRTRTEAVMHAVVDLLDELGPRTPAELEHEYDARRARMEWPRMAPYNVHKRVSQMKKHLRVLRGSGIRDAGAERVELTTDALRAHGLIKAHMQEDEE